MNWKIEAAAWLGKKAEEQEETNRLYPDHVKCYPRWVDRAEILRQLSNDLSHEALVDKEDGKKGQKSAPEHEFIRGRLMEQLKAQGTPVFANQHLSWASLRYTEWCPEFESHMRDRLMMGFFRYGAFQDPFKPSFKQIESAIRRLQNYLNPEHEQYGNAELLVDAANLCMVEWKHPNNPAFHFLATDDGEEHAEPIK